MVLGGGKHWVGFFVVVGFHCGATRSLIGWERSGVVWVHGGGFSWMDRGRRADGNQGKYPRGQVSRCVLRVRLFVGANRGVTFLGQQESVVHNWWT